MQNKEPIFTLVPQIGTPKNLSAANTKSDGAGTIGTDIFKIFEAHATNGSYVSSVRVTPFASVAATATTATVIRIFLSSQTSGTVTSANCWLLQEIPMPTQTADHSTVAIFPNEIPINRAIPAGYTILATTHAVPAANTGFMAIAFGGDF